MALDIQGIGGVSDYSAQIRNDISVIAINWYVNRTPLVTRIPRIPVESSTFTMVNRTYRARSLTLAGAYNNTATTLTFSDVSMLMVGDVIENQANFERMEVTADPNITAGTITVVRGVEGTAASADSTTTDNFLLIGNSRTGAEINQNGVAFRPVGVPQYAQTFQFPVQLGGSAAAQKGLVLPPGAATPFGLNKMDALQNMMDDMESTSYYGIGDPGTSGTYRRKQKGLRKIIGDGAPSNYVNQPVNAGAYKPTDFIRDTMEQCRRGGGDPDVLIVSTNFMTGLATWGQPAMRIDAGINKFGVPIDVFETPFLGGLSIIEAPLLKPYSAICLTSSEIQLRVVRPEFWNPRGVRGDADEGDWMAEVAIEANNPAHHAFLEGVTAFSST